jgi:exodeoxyribonuclease V gamma subunit
VVRGILPYEEMEGDAVQPLASLVSFMHTLWEVQDACRASMTPEEWSTLFLHVLDTGIQAEASQNWQEDSLRAVVRELDRSSTHGAYDSPLSHGAVRWWVRARLDRERSSRRFASGGVTFCSMLPMRTVPFTFIGMLGLNQETYPRQDHLPAFDLIHTQTRPGDRTRRDDDRHLFLESLMSARQVIRISWVGRSIRDNNETPPSVVVAELLDWLGAACTPEHGEGSSTPQTLTRMHPLQPFSPLRFCTPSIDRGSHDPVYALAAKAMLGDQEVEPRFMESILPLPEHAQLEIPLHTLLRCVENPSRTLLQDRLGLQLQRWEDTLKEREALAPDSLDLYPLRAAVLDLLVQGLDPEGAWAQLKPTGLFPGGPVGRCLFDGLMAEMDELIEVVRPWHEGERVPQQEVDLNVPTKRGPTRVYGSLTDLRPNAQLLLIPAKLKEKYRLRAWVRHLVLCALEGDDLPRTTVIAGVNPKPGKNEPRYKIVEFMEVEDPLPLLGRLVGMYWWSMQEPVAFFPEVSWPASDPDFQRDLNLDEQVRESRKHFRPLIVPAGLAPKRGARPDPWVRRIYARLDPFQTPSPYSCSFRGITRVVYDDMRAHTVREP